MSGDDKERLNRITLEALNEGRLTVLDEVVADDMDDHSAAPGLPAGRDGLRAAIEALRQAFPDVHYELEHVIQEGDLVVQHMHASGTMQGDFAGLKGNGRRAAWDEVHIMRVAGGVMVEHWGIVDELAILHCLGYAPGGSEPSRMR